MQTDFLKSDLLLDIKAYKKKIKLKTIVVHSSLYISSRKRLCVCVSVVFSLEKEKLWKSVVSWDRVKLKWWDSAPYQSRGPYELQSYVFLFQISILLIL